MPKLNISAKNLLSVVLLIVAAAIVLAAHTIGPSSFSFNEDTNNVYNISVQNTDTGANANITQVNITFPSSFTFDAGSNGTDAGAHTFISTASVLSWTNTAGLVMNSSTNYFWFNATASTPGFYNLTVETVNASGIQNSNITVEINDTTAPNITLQAPANATSGTTNAYNFTFNASDFSAISNCSLIFNNAIIHFISAVNNGLINGMYNSSLSVGTHNWSVNCTDSLNYEGASEERVLAITQSSSPSSSSSSSGGSSTSGTGFTILEESEIKKGTKEIIFPKKKIRFPIDGKDHLFTTKSLNEKQIEFTVESEMQSFTLALKEEVKVELTGDNVYDLLARYEEFKISNKGYVYLKSISEPMPPVAQAPSKDKTQEETRIQESPPAQAPQTAQEAKKSSVLPLIIFMLIVIALFIAMFIYLSKSKRKRS